MTDAVTNPVIVRVCRGTEAAPEAVQAGDATEVQFKFHDGTGYADGARIGVYATGPAVAGEVPVVMQVYMQRPGLGLIAALTIQPDGSIIAFEATHALKAAAFSGCAFSELPDPNANWGVRDFITDSLVPLNSETVGETAQGGGIYWVPVHSANIDAESAEWKLG